MFNRFVSLGAILGIGLLLAGCYRDFGPVVAEPQPLPPPLTATHIQVGDRLTVTVYDEPNMLGISTQSVIEAWDGLRLRRRP